MRGTKSQCLEKPAKLELPSRKFFFNEELVKKTISGSALILPEQGVQIKHYWHKICSDFRYGAPLTRIVLKAAPYFLGWSIPYYSSSKTPYLRIISWRRMKLVGHRYDACLKEAFATEKSLYCTVHSLTSHWRRNWRIFYHKVNFRIYWIVWKRWSKRKHIYHEKCRGYGSGKGLFGLNEGNTCKENWGSYNRDLWWCFQSRHCLPTFSSPLEWIQRQKLYEMRWSGNYIRATRQWDEFSWMVVVEHLTCRNLHLIWCWRSWY